jgi:hypothetical protein
MSRPIFAAMTILLTVLWAGYTWEPLSSGDPMFMSLAALFLATLLVNALVWSWGLSIIVGGGEPITWAAIEEEIACYEALLRLACFALAFGLGVLIETLGSALQRRTSRQWAGLLDDARFGGDPYPDIPQPRRTTEGGDLEMRKR